MATHTRVCLFLRLNCRARRQLSRLHSTQTGLTNTEVRERRNAIFDEERKRQLSLITRIEKIQVEFKGTPEDCTLVMNKGLSTPFNCAMHIQDLLVTRSALALVNGKPWDIHRPLVADCDLQFLHFRDEDPRLLNKAFWRSCSFVLGHVLETAFKDEHRVNLISFPQPDVHSGSFVYDADIDIPDWTPSTVELNSLSRIAYKLYHDDLRFERLEVDVKVAERMFADNPHKSRQVPQIASRSLTGSKVTVYRMGEHVDMSRGPLISSTSHLGRFSVTAVHRMVCPEIGPILRFQGVALPTQIKMHYWAYQVLTKRAAKLNPAPLPSEISSIMARDVAQKMEG